MAGQRGERVRRGAGKAGVAGRGRGDFLKGKVVWSWLGWVGLGLVRLDWVGLDRSGMGKCRLVWLMAWWMGWLVV